jgi:hypothetical protein
MRLSRQPVSGSNADLSAKGASNGSLVESAHMIRSGLAMLVGALFAGLPTALVAQETLVWSDIDCAKSKLVIPAGLSCKETNTAGTRNAAKSTGGGLTKRWSAFGTLQQVKLYYYVHDDFDGKSFVQVRDLAGETSNMGNQAKGATVTSGPEKRGDADLVTFTNAVKDSCIGIRKYGQPRGGGFSWVLWASRCIPAGQKASDTDINAFITGAGFRQ